MNIDFRSAVSLIGPINIESAGAIFRDTIKLIEKNPDKETFLIINSGGGSVDVGNSIIDLLPKLSPNLVTVGSGLVGSMAIPVLLCANKRYITKHTRFYFHEIGRSYGNQRLGVGEVESDLKDLKSLQNWYVDYVSMRTKGKIKVNQVRRWMSDETTIYPDKIIEYGFAEKVI